MEEQNWKLCLLTVTTQPWSPPHLPFPHSYLMAAQFPISHHSPEVQFPCTRHITTQGALQIHSCSKYHSLTYVIMLQSDTLVGIHTLTSYLHTHAHTHCNPAQLFPQTLKIQKLISTGVSPLSLKRVLSMIEGVIPSSDQQCGK